MRYRRALLAAGLVFSLLAAAPTLAMPTAQTCELTLGFALFRGVIPHIVGDCAGAPRIDPATGVIEQNTSRGMFTKRNNPKWPYWFVEFTDGTTTHLYGPEGYQTRLNTAAKFAWENSYVFKREPGEMLSRAGYDGPFDPYFPDRNCENFQNQNEAQGFFMAAGWRENPPFDRHGLDPELDGHACFMIVPTPTFDDSIFFTPTETPAATATPGPDVDCVEDDFDTQEEAQEFFEEAGGPENDPYELDENSNGIACETLPTEEDLDNEDFDDGDLDNLADNTET